MNAGRSQTSPGFGFALPRSGFTLIEFVIVVIVIGILAGILLARLLPLIGEAERVGLMRIEAELKNALTMETAKRMVQGRSAEIPALNGANPMDFVLEAPVTYLGELDGPDPAAIPVRKWYFDTATRHLVYRVSSRRFESSLGPPARAEYMVAVSFDDLDGSGVFEPAHDDFRGVRLVPVAAYRWREH